MKNESDLDFSVLENLDWEQACESRLHEEGYRPFMGSERPPARWILLGTRPCRAKPSGIVICDSCKVAVKNFRDYNCGACGVRHDVDRQTFLVEALKP